MYDKLFRTASPSAVPSPRETGASEHAQARASTQTRSETHDAASAFVSEPRSGREIAIENEIVALSALHQFGWLTSRQVAAWTWPNGSQQVQMARRTLSRLKASGQLLVGTLPNGVPVYTLSASGAARLRDHGIDARSGKDVRMGRWEHRAICNWHAILLAGYGYQVSSEHELYTGRASIRHWCGKLADVIGEEDGQFRWVEVEHSRRRPSDMEKLLKLIINGSLDPAYAHDVTLEVIELVTTDLRLTNAIAVALEKEMRKRGLTPEVRQVIRTSVAVTRLQISPGLVLTDHSYFAMPLPTPDLPDEEPTEGTQDEPGNDSDSQC